MLLGILLLLSAGLAFVFQRFISGGIVYLAKTAQHITESKDYTIRVEKKSNDEIGMMYESFNQMLGQIEKQNGEIQEINQGLEDKIEQRLKDIRIEKDRAESASQEAVALAKELDEKREFESKINEFTELLQSKSNESIEVWGDRLLADIVEKTGALQAALYTVDVSNQDELELVSTYAFDLKNTLKKRIEKKDSLTGQAARSKKMILLNNIPIGYLKSQTTLSNVQPGSLIILPLIAEDTIQGLLELTSFQPFTMENILYLQKITDNFGSSLVIIRSKNHIEQLLSQTQEINMQLAQNEEELRNVNENLELMVSHRTAELEATLENLQSTQNQLIESEKMASLGQLIAGIAHEINTPIGAIKASSGNMQDVLPGVLLGLTNVISHLNKSHLTLFINLLETILKAEKNLSSKEERTFRKEMQTLLEKNNISNGEDIARKLVEIGVTDTLEAYFPLFKLANQESLLDLIYKFGQLKVNLDNIDIASEKTKKIVFALKSYAHKTESEELIPTNLQQSLDIILTLYSNQIKYGVNLHTHYDKVPEVLCNPDEIGQVWTNIIHNGLQAMNYNGELTIDLREKDKFAVVSITDNGPGIPQEVKGRIFEPFFTTKAQGEGTGLGLDICSKIIEKHGGTIEVESIPGNTCFMIKLPIISAN